MPGTKLLHCPRPAPSSAKIVCSHIADPYGTVHQASEVPMPESLDVSRARNGSFTAKARHLAAHTLRRLPWSRRTKTDNRNLLPLLIQVLAGFSKVAGRVLEEEIDSS